MNKKAFIEVEAEIFYCTDNIMTSGQMTPQGVYDSEQDWIIG